MRLYVLTQPLQHKPDSTFNYNSLNSLDNYSVYTKLPVRYFAKLCCNGYTWVPGEFKESAKRKRAENAIGANAIGLDIDSGDKSPEEFVAYAESIGLTPNFYYYTFSQDLNLIELPEDKEVIESDLIGLNQKVKDGYRYRVVWLLDESIEPKTYRELMEVLIFDTFKDFNPDKAPRNIANLFYGGGSYSVIINTEKTKLSTLGWAKVMEVSKQGKSNRTLHNQKRAGAQEWEKVEVPDSVKVDANWVDKLRPYCDLLDKWMDGRYINYNQRLTLWSNLRFLKRKDNNASIIDDLMSYVRPEVYEGHTFSRNEIKSKFGDTKLKPAPIVKYQGRRITVPTFFKDFSGAAIETDKSGLMSLEELDAWMDEQVPKAVMGSGFTYFKSQTASGKTERIIQTLVANSFKVGKVDKVIYAVPTHNLAAEIEQRFNKAIQEAKADLQVYRVPPRDYSERDLLLLKLGLKAEIRDEIRSQEINKLFDPNIKGIFIITHSLLVNLNGDLKVDRIIVDENIEEALINNIKVSVSQLRSLLGYLPTEHQTDLTNYIQEVKENSLGHILPPVLPELINKIDRKEYVSEVSEETAIAGLFSLEKAQYIKVSTQKRKPCIRAMIKSELINNCINNNIPIKLFTATPMSQRIKNQYKLVFDLVEPDRLTMNKGNVIQYRALSGARGMSNGKGMELSKFNKMEKYIHSKLSKKIIENAATITFKGGKDLFEEKGFTVATYEGVEIHLTNNAGLDMFKGKDIIVVGKFDLPDEYYLDLWSDIGDGSIPAKQNQRLFRNGVYQTLFLWNKEELRNEQLEYLEYTTQQAIGRARALREDANVYLFSNYVPEGVDKIYD